MYRTFNDNELILFSFFPSHPIQVGYKSSLRASQSISDLSHANVDARTRLLRGVVGKFIKHAKNCLLTFFAFMFVGFKLCLISLNILTHLNTLVVDNIRRLSFSIRKLE